MEDPEKVYFDDMNILLTAYEFWRYENKNKQVFKQLNCEGNGFRMSASADMVGSLANIDPIKEQNHCVQKISLAMDTPKYELFVNVVGVVNLVCIVIRQYTMDTTSQIYAWIYVQMAINSCFLVELVTDLYVHKIKSYSKHFRVWPETICQVLNAYAVALHLLNLDNVEQVNTLVKTFEFIIFLRLLKLLTLLYEIRSMRLIIETLRNMLLPLVYLWGVLLIIFYIFALLGMLFFGGLVNKDLPNTIKDGSVPNNYYMDNFNDLLSSLVTLFTLMVVNNWMVQVQMYVDVMGDANYTFYFVAFYYCSVIIGINIIVAFTLDMYSSVERLDEERMETLEMLEKKLAG